MHLVPGSSLVYTLTVNNLDCLQKAYLPSEDNLPPFRILMREATVLRHLPKCNSKKCSEPWKLHAKEHVASHREDIDWGRGGAH